MKISRAVALGFALAALLAPAARADGPGVGAPWIVSVGDSYISGEAGRWAGNTDESSAMTDALGSTAYFDNFPRTAEVIRGCHRSWSAEVFIGGGVNGLTLACSGAETQTAFSNGNFKPGLDFFYNQKGNVGQAMMLQNFARLHNVKMIPLSIGGNDFNFGSIVTQCVKDYLKPYVTSPYLCKDDSDVQANFKPAVVAARTDAIAHAIQNIRTAMAKAGYADSAYTILVQNYESAIPMPSNFRYPQYGGGLDPRPRLTTGGCGFNDADADWANRTALPIINGAVQHAIAQTKLPNVGFLDLSQAFNGHELCAKSVGLLEKRGLSSWKQAGAVDASEWIDQIRIATVGTPYFQQESLHPNYWGQLALRTATRRANTGGKPHGGRGSIAGPGVNAAGEPQMRLPGATVTRRAASALHVRGR